MGKASLENVGVTSFEKVCMCDDRVVFQITPRHQADECWVGSVLGRRLTVTEETVRPK
jgi:hypothetical protein